MISVRDVAKAYGVHRVLDGVSLEVEPAGRPIVVISSDREVADTWRDAMWGKLAGHGIDDPGFLQPDR